MCNVFYVIVSDVDGISWYLSALHKDCALDFTDLPCDALYFPWKWVAHFIADSISHSSKYPIRVAKCYYGKEGFEYEKV